VGTESGGEIKANGFVTTSVERLNFLAGAATKIENTDAVGVRSQSASK
jgi:hypothetical protein